MRKKLLLYRVEQKIQDELVFAALFIGLGGMIWIVLALPFIFKVASGLFCLVGLSCLISAGWRKFVRYA